MMQRDADTVSELTVSFTVDSYLAHSTTTKCGREVSFASAGWASGSDNSGTEVRLFHSAGAALGVKIVDVTPAGSKRLPADWAAGNQSGTGDWRDRQQSTGQPELKKLVVVNGNGDIKDETDCLILDYVSLLTKLHLRYCSSREIFCHMVHYYWLVCHEIW